LSCYSFSYVLLQWQRLLPAVQQAAAVWGPAQQPLLLGSLLLLPQQHPGLQLVYQARQLTHLARRGAPSQVGEKAGMLLSGLAVMPPIGRTPAVATDGVPAVAPEKPAVSTDDFAAALPATAGPAAWPLLLPAPGGCCASSRAVGGAGQANKVGGAGARPGQCWCRQAQYCQQVQLRDLVVLLGLLRCRPCLLLPLLVDALLASPAWRCSVAANEMQHKDSNPNYCIHWQPSKHTNALQTILLPAWPSWTEACQTSACWDRSQSPTETCMWDLLREQHSPVPREACWAAKASKTATNSICTSAKAWGWHLLPCSPAAWAIR